MADDTTLNDSLNADRAAAAEAERKRVEQDRKDAADKAEAERKRVAEAKETERKEYEARAERDRTGAAKKPDVFGSKPAADTNTARAKLRGFEDAHFGRRAVRIDGRIERGYGSPFKGLSDEKQAEYAALERLVVAEQAVDDANVAVSNAKSSYDEALESLALAQKSAQDQADENKKADEEAKADAAASK